jgi:hypothetical protein
MNGNGLKRACFVVLRAIVVLLTLSGLARAQLQLQTSVSGLTLPVEFVQDPGNPAIQYVVEQQGRIRTIVNGRLVTTPFLDVSPLVSCCGELRLLGLAFPPDYAASGRFYIDTSMGLATWWSLVTCDRPETRCSQMPHRGSPCVGAAHLVSPSSFSHMRTTTAGTLSLGRADTSPLGQATEKYPTI